MSSVSTLSYILKHPLNRGQSAAAIARYVGWQIGSRLIREHTHRWVGDTRLVVRNGMTGATGNIYCGLHEYVDMALLLHYLRADDLFLDIGANIGSYTVLASGVCRARTIAFEPDPVTILHLKRNVAHNALDDLVCVHETSLGAATGIANFTVGRDTMNQVVMRADENTRSVAMQRLDDVPGVLEAAMIKLDVEGFEADVLAGAQNVLTSPNLRVIETEGQNDQVTACLEGAGFLRMHYDPRTRKFSATAMHDLTSSNAFFLRDMEFVARRVTGAPKCYIHGQAI
jgi:FkbM family methyltransferase